MTLEGEDFPVQPRMVVKPDIKVAGVEFSPELHGWHLVPTLFFGLCRALPQITNAAKPGALFGYIFSRSGRADSIDTYLACVEVSGHLDYPEGIATATIPAGEYAAFTVKGGLGDIHAAYHHINHDWLPKSGYAPATCGAVEFYDNRFVPNGTCEFEIWTPVERQIQQH